MTAAAAIALSSVLLFVARGRDRCVDPLLLWGIAMGCGAIGLVLYISPLPNFLRQDVAKGLMLLGTAVAWAAVRIFAGKRPSIIAMVIGPMVWFAACQIPAFNVSADARLGLSCSIGAIYTALSAVALWPDGSEPLPSRAPALILLLLHAVLYFARASLAFTGRDHGWDGPLTSLMMLEAQLHTMGMAFILVAMTKERAELQAGRHLEAARQAGEARGRFLARISHEVRPPLRGMLNLTQLLVRDPSLRADQRHHIETLEAGSHHLLAIVNDALDLRNIDAGRFDIAIEPFNPTEAVEACLALVRSAAIEKRIVLRSYADGDPHGMLDGDPRRLRQIMLNLLWNAIKCTPDGGAVTVSTTGTGQFDVRDTGPQISLKDRATLFTHHAPDGAASSLGLAISHNLADQLGGRLTHQPGLDGLGNIFRLTLPWPQSSKSENLDQPAQDRDA